MILRIHTYAGLLVFLNLVLYAVVGIAASAGARNAPSPVVWEQPFEAPPHLSDRQVAEQVVRLLGLSLATPVHDFAIGHDGEGRLKLDFYHVNGRHEITLLERPGRLRVSHTRANFLRYLSTLHVTTAAFHSGDWRMQLWAWWNEFAMWCVAVMAASGAWIWWGKRVPLPGRGLYRGMLRVHRYTALGALAAVAVYEISAVQMAHRTWIQAGPLIRAFNRIHRMRGIGLGPPLGASLLILGATGLWLWWKLRRDRLAGTALFGMGMLVAGGLIWWMRV